MSARCCLPIALVLLASPLIRAAEPAPNTLTDQEKAAGWKLLFDGKTTEGWRNYKKPDIGKGWKVENGALVRSASGAGDIITTDKYGAFELSLEFNIAKEGNSGLMFHVAETGDAPWHTGPEIQIQDNVAGHDPQKSGWLYQLYHPDFDATKPAGEWNHLRILLAPKGKTSTVWMNGKKYYDFELGSADWDARVAKSKFKDMKGFGNQGKGYICLQNHGDEVEYRNIKIRVIDGKESSAAAK